MRLDHLILGQKNVSNPCFFDISAFLPLTLTPNHPTKSSIGSTLPIDITMNKLLLGLLMLMTQVATAQLPPPLLPNGIGEKPGISVFYYPFRNGLQMIEVDYRSGYEFHMAQYVDKGYVPPYGGKSINTYYFRNTQGEIVKTFNQDSTDIRYLASNLEPVDFVNKKYHISDRWNHYYEQGQSDGYYNIYEREQQGVIDSLGNVVIPVEYDYVIHKPNCFLAFKDKKNRLIVLGEKPSTTDFYDSYYTQKLFIHLIDKRSIKATYKYETREMFNFSNAESVDLIGEDLSILKIKRKGKWGIWDPVTEQLLLRYEYDHINYCGYLYQKEYDYLIFVKKNEKYGIVSWQNHICKTILPCEYDKINFIKTDSIPYQYKKGWIRVEKNGRTKDINLLD